MLDTLNQALGTLKTQDQALHILLATPIALYLLRLIRNKWLTLRASSPTPIVARTLAPLFATYKYSEDEFYACDGAPPDVVDARRAGLAALAKRFDAAEGPKARELNEQLRGLSDIRFTDTNRVPHAFQPVVRKKLRLGFLAVESDGPYIVDVDGNRALDISGSYGVNVHGYDFYKDCTAEGHNRVAKLGPNVLGPLHPVVFDVIKMLKVISKLEEVSFHCSGTEAMMCAVRLCRFNTKRRLIVQFIGAYHGWWDGVQPGPGNERDVPDVLTLKDLSPLSLKLIRARAHEIAAVLVSPLQGLNPGSSPPSDLVLMAAEARKTADKDDKYREWLETLRTLCTDVNVPLVFDEVYTGFRMAVGGAQQYYGVNADMVAYGKSLGGGMPVGVVCGKKELMARFDPEHPLRVSYVIGTFAAAPSILGPMAAFLEYVMSSAAQAKYEKGNMLTAKFVSETNKRMAAGGYPVRVDSLTTVFTFLYKSPSRFHWMFQYYMRAEGLAMSWVGTGRCLFSLDMEEAEYELVTNKLLAAAQKMKEDGWWWDGATPGSIKRAIVWEALMGMLPSFITKKSV